MSSHHQSMSQHHRRRRKSYLPSLSTVVTTAVLAVGTYHVAKWAWENVGSKQHSQPQSQSTAHVHGDTGEEEEVLVEEEEVTVIEEEVEEEHTVDETLVEVLDDESHHHLHHNDGGGSVASHNVRFLLPGRRSETPTRHRGDEEERPALPHQPKAPPPSANGSHPQSHRPHHSHQPSTAAQWQLRRQRMSRCRDETAAALAGFMATARKVIDERTDTLPETKALKQLRASNKNRGPPPPPPRDRGGGGDSITSLSESTFRRERERELWERVKIRSITRVLATAYAHTILFLVLTVQVNLLGGRLFEEQVLGMSQTPSSSKNDDGAAAAAAAHRLTAYQSSHRLVLTHTYRYFFERGLHALLDAVEQAASTALASWDVLDPASLHMTRGQFEEGLAKVRAAVKEGAVPSGSPAPGHCRSLLRFLSPPPAPPLVSASSSSSPPPASSSAPHLLSSPPVHLPDDLARSILDETWDLLESPVLEDALAECLSVTFNALRDWHWGGAFEVEPSSQPSAAAPSNSVASPTLATRPLATILTRLKRTARSFYEPDPATTANGATTALTISTAEPPVATPLLSPYCAILERLPSVLELADVSFS